MRKLLVWSMLLVVAAGAFAAGGQESADPAGRSQDLTFWRAGLDEPTRLFYQREIQKFEEANPGTTIQFQEYDWSDDIETKLNVGFASGTGPDILRYVISSIADRASREQYAPLDDYIDSWQDADDIVDSSYEIGSYLGTRYGISVQADPMFLIYRKDYFEEAGLDPDTPPETWSELKEYARALTVRESDRVVRGGLEIPTAGRGHHRIIMFARMNGAALVDFDRNVPLFTEPEVIEAMDYLASFNRDGLLVPYRMPQDESPFRQGRSAMVFGSRGEVAQILRIHPEWEGLLGYGEVRGETQSSFSGAQIYFIPTGSKDPDTSWDFITHLLEKDTMWSMYEELGTIPVRKSLVDRFVQDNPELHRIVSNALGYGDGNPKVTWAPLFVKYIDQAYEQAMYGQPAAEALKQAEELLLADIRN